MRIGLDHRPALYGRGGIAVYVRELVAAYASAHPQDQLELYAHRLRRPAARAARALGPNARLRRSRLPAPALALAARAGLGADRLLGRVDVLHWTDYVPLRSTRAPVVATIHDVLFESLPDCYTPAQRRRLRTVTARAVAEAQRLIVPSVRAKAELCARFHADPERTHVVPHGRTALPAAAPAAGLGDYVLFVGTLEPRKNLLRLMEAMDQVAADGVRLVVAGARGWLDDRLRAAIAARPSVLHEGAVDDARLAALYGGALAVAVPSLGEGFGLPVLEAMAHGRALLVGADTACADLAGDAALAVDPASVDALAAGLRRLLGDGSLRARLGDAGRARAASYTWERCARETRRVYELAQAS